MTLDFEPNKPQISELQQSLRFRSQFFKNASLSLHIVQSSEGGRRHPVVRSTAELDTPLWQTSTLQARCEDYSGKHIVGFYIVFRPVSGTFPLRTFRVCSLDDYRYPSPFPQSKTYSTALPPLKFCYVDSCDIRWFPKILDGTLHYEVCPYNIKYTSTVLG